MDTTLSGWGKAAGLVGDHQARRALGNCLVGILHSSLKTHTHYNEHTAWQTRAATAA